MYPRIQRKSMKIQRKDYTHYFSKAFKAFSVTIKLGCVLEQCFSSFLAMCRGPVTSNAEAARPLVIKFYCK